MWEVLKNFLEPILTSIRDALLARFGQSRKERKADEAQIKERLKQINKKNQDSENQDSETAYNEIILKHFVKRRFRAYIGRKRTRSIRDILAKIEVESGPYALFLTGEPGMGKSTALKWLYLHAKLKEPPIFLRAIDFKDCANMDAFFQVLEAQLYQEGAEDAKKRATKGAVIFLDGLDELKCVQGTSNEFTQILRHLNDYAKSNGKAHRFVISSRPEHFKFYRNLLKERIKDIPKPYVYEILPLNITEAIGVCKSVEVLANKKEGSTDPHFADKYPEKKGEEICYLFRLWRYLIKYHGKDALLSSPLLCRYAYQIVQEWSDDKSNGVGNTLTERIHKALERCIKWEYHDHRKESTRTGSGKAELKQYTKRVMDFLSNLAGRTTPDEPEGKIPRKVWDKLRSGKQEMELNAAYCVLREDKNEDALYFTHSVFYEFFLARFFASRRKYRESEQLRKLLKNNDNFAMMYVELLATVGDNLARHVCGSLQTTMIDTLPLSKKEQYTQLARYAKGEMYSKFERNAEDSKFTVQDFLRVFPFGSVWYIGLEWNRFNFSFSSGILKITHEEFLKLIAYRPDKLGDIRGVKLTQSGFYSLQVVFTYVNQKEEHEIAFRCSVECSSDEEKRNIYDPDVRANIEMCYEKCSKEEEILLRNRRDDAIRFLGERKQFWCLFWANELYVYEDSTSMAEVLKKMRKKRFDAFLYVYGNYRAFCGISPQTFRWIKTEAVSVSLNRTPVIGTEATRKEDNLISAVKQDANLVKNSDFQAISYATFLSYYHSTHVHNYIFSESLVEQTSEAAFSDSILLNSSFNYLRNSLEKFYRMRYLPFPKASAEPWKRVDTLRKRYAEAMDEDERDLLRLHIGDEYLITHYFLGDWEAVRGFAEETLPLCERYNHPDGEKLRKILLADNSEELRRLLFPDKEEELHPMARFQWIRDYVRNYIWI